MRGITASMDLNINTRLRRSLSGLTSLFCAPGMWFIPAPNNQNSTVSLLTLKSCPVKNQISISVCKNPTAPQRLQNYHQNYEKINQQFLYPKKMFYCSLLIPLHSPLVVGQCWTVRLPL